MPEQSWTQVITAATALVAVIVGPFISVHLVKRQIHASVVSASRQKWIDALRDQISEIIAVLRVVGLHRSLDTISKTELDERIENLALLESKITLMLNPDEDDHKAIVAIIRQAIETIGAGNESEKRVAMQKHVSSLIAQSQIVLKREWRRVKSGD